MNKKETKAEGERLIKESACILFDRMEWGKNWSVTILPPPPHFDAVIRSAKPKKSEKYKVYIDVLEMVEDVIAVAQSRDFPSDFPCVFRTEKSKGVYSIIKLSILPRLVSDLKKEFETKAKKSLTK